MRRGIWYSASVALASVLVALAGTALSGDGSRAGIWQGVAVAGVVQVLGFWLLFVWALPQSHALAYLLGMVGRFAVVGLMALVWIPLAGLPPAPTLFALVAVFFVTTLFEPMFLHSESLTRR